MRAIAVLLLIATSAVAAPPRIIDFAASRDAIDLDLEQGTWLSGRLDTPRATASWRVAGGAWQRMRIVKGSHGEPRVLAFVTAAELPSSGTVRLEARACAGDDCSEPALVEVPLLARLGLGWPIDDLSKASWEKSWKTGAEAGVQASGGVLEGGGVVLRGERAADGGAARATVQALWSGTPIPIAGTEGLALRLRASEGAQVFAGLAAGREADGPNWVRLPTFDSSSWIFLRWSSLLPPDTTATSVTSLGVALALPPGGVGSLEIAEIRTVVRDGTPWARASRVAVQPGNFDPHWPGVSTRATERTVMPCAKERGCLVTTATTADGSPLRLLIDTGAYGCMMRTPVAERLGIEPRSTLPLDDGFGVTEIPAAWLHELRVGPLRVDGAWAGLFEQDMPSDEPIDGALAPSVLPEGLVTLDFAAGTLTSEPGTLPPADGITILDIEEGLDGVVVILPLAGEPRPFLLDTGSTIAVSLGSDVAAGLRLLSPPVETDLAATALRQARITSTRAAGALELGGIRIVDPIVSFMGDERGSVGVSVLERYTMTLDYRSQRVRLVPRVSGDVRPPAMKSNGLIAGRSADGTSWVAKNVLAESPAARKRIQPGDTIREVNGQSTAGITYARWEELERSPIRLVVEGKDGVARRVRLRAETLVR